MSDVVYGFPCVDNPNDFTPDPECCTPQELAAHAEACRQWNDGTYQRDPSKHCQSTFDGDGKLVMHVSRTPWGIGTSSVDWDDDEDGELVEV
jgi:hypothetical protein